MVSVRSPKPLNMRLYMPLKKATEEYPVSRRTLWRWIAEGTLQYERVKRGQRCQIFVLISSLQQKFVPESQ